MSAQGGSLDVRRRPHDDRAHARATGEPVPLAHTSRVPPMPCPTSSPSLHWWRR